MQSQPAQASSIGLDPLPIADRSLAVDYVGVCRAPGFGEDGMHFILGQGSSRRRATTSLCCLIYLSLVCLHRDRVVLTV